ncbi:DUF3558 domain-containing protein [Streptomyces bluensis]|uniref:DUF3558 domain-containing protein n=1 Tax=Streptomyces bluensis TaxID=33897 RepID=UPI00369615EE
MHRSAQRDQHHHRGGRGRGARGVRRFLVGAAALPVMLVAAGCSSDSGSGDDAAKAKESASPTAKQSATASPNEVQAAAYGKLPEACTVLSKKTLEDLVPEGAKSGKAINDGQPDVSGDCRWISLDNNGVKGSQYRWLSVSLLLLESDASRGAGDERARAQFEKRLSEARAVEGAKNVKSESVTGTGDQATVVRYDLKKKEGSFKQQTVVARVENVVITLDYNGAGLAGEKTPDADDLVKGAKAAARQIVAAVGAANGEESGAGSSASPSTSEGGEPSASASASASPSKKS